MAIDFNRALYILDGAMGTMLQQAGMASHESTTRFGLEHPEILQDIHRQYIEAGADIIYASTFGINRFKKEELPGDVESCVGIAMGAALAARDEGLKNTGREIKVAVELGPLGELLEPMGTLPFEDAYEAFGEVVRAGAACGADLAVIETMTDLYEVKAALLAVKEHSHLPVLISMSFEENGRTFMGVSLEAMAGTLEGLGADAIGINCSLGPEQILPMAKRLQGMTSLPVLVKPNAGLPDPATGKYDITCPQFVEKMGEYADLGIRFIGGCCGTTPEYIRGLTAYRDEKQAPGRKETEQAGEKEPGRLKICSGTRVVQVDHVTVVGERINPTGKKRLKQALLEGDLDYVLAQAVAQADEGAEVLDVNVGVPGVDDVKLLPAVVKRLQSVTDLPLQIDSGNPAAIEAALRVYNGKAIVNSVNGEEAVMEAIFPAVKKYGAAVIGLTLDEKGIPATARERVAIAARILQRATDYGIRREDVIIDCLTLTASAQQKEVEETLKAVRMVKEELGLATTLGVSNISFGLPLRPVINRTFLALALENGLDLPIIDPGDAEMSAAVAAFNVLKNRDENAAIYIDKYGGETQPVIGENPAASKAASKGDSNAALQASPDIFHCIEKGMEGETAEAVRRLLQERDELEVVNKYLIPALDRVGQGFEKGTIFLPQMLQAAQAAQAGFDVIKTRLAEQDRGTVSLGKVVIATVKGDIHDIGKNIVKVIMENYGYEMIDLGRDVPAERVLKAIREKNVRLVGLSALMTTTLGSMEETIEAIHREAPDCRIMVGGAVLTEEYARKIGADFYCKDAMKSVEAAQEVFA